MRPTSWTPDQPVVQPSDRACDVAEVRTSVIGSSSPLGLSSALRFRAPSQADSVRLCRTSLLAQLSMLRAAPRTPQQCCLLEPLHACDRSADSPAEFSRPSACMLHVFERFVQIQELRAISLRPQLRDAGVSWAASCTALGDPLSHLYALQICMCAFAISTNTCQGTR